MKNYTKKRIGKNAPPSPKDEELILAFATCDYNDATRDYLTAIRVADKAGVWRTRITEITGLHAATVKKICDDLDYQPPWGNGR